MNFCTLVHNKFLCFWVRTQIFKISFKKQSLRLKEKQFVGVTVKRIEPSIKFEFVIVMLNSAIIHPDAQRRKSLCTKAHLKRTTLLKQYSCYTI